MLPAELSCLKPSIIEDLKRFGKSADGGYLLPASRLNEIDGVISFGLADDWSLEKELSIIRPAIPIYVYDHTVGKSVFRQSVKSALRDVATGLCKLCLFRTPLSDVKSRIKVYQSRKAVFRDYEAFFPEKAKHLPLRVFNRHEKGADTTIDDVFAMCRGNSHLFVKMDIEGGEYRVIPQILKYASDIDLMVIEFHDTEPLRDLFLRQVKEILIAFDIVHIHGNNFAGPAEDGLPELLEMTFLNRRLIGNSLCRRDRLPIEGLDMPNDPTKPDLPLMFA